MLINSALLIWMGCFRMTYAQLWTESADMSRSDRSSDHLRTDVFCERLDALTELNNTASNPSIASLLGKLSSNTTLVADCDMAKANLETAFQCRQLSKLEARLDERKTMKSTAYSSAGGLLQEKQQKPLTGTMEKAELELQRLRMNTTLINICNSQPDFTGKEKAEGMLGKSRHHKALPQYCRC